MVFRMKAFWEDMRLGRRRRAVPRRGCSASLSAGLWARQCFTRAMCRWSGCTRSPAHSPSPPHTGTLTHTCNTHVHTTHAHAATTPPTTLTASCSSSWWPRGGPSPTWRGAACTSTAPHRRCANLLSSLRPTPEMSCINHTLINCKNGRLPTRAQPHAGASCAAPAPTPQYPTTLDTSPSILRTVAP